MFNSTMLEVGIGLVFVYLLFSLACTAFNELIAATLRSRANMLWKGIQNLLEKDPNWAGKAATVAAAALHLKTDEAVQAEAAVKAAEAKLETAKAKVTAADNKAKALAAAHKAAADAMAPEAGAPPSAAEVAALLPQSIRAAAAHGDAAGELADAKAAEQAATAEQAAASRSAGAANRALLVARWNQLQAEVTSAEARSRQAQTRKVKLTVKSPKASEAIADAGSAEANAKRDLQEKQQALSDAWAAASQADLDAAREAGVTAPATSAPAAADPHDDEDGAWANRLYNHSLIQAMYQNPTGRALLLGFGEKIERPSYIPSQTFAIALMDLVAPAGGAKSLHTFDDIRAAVDGIPDSAVNHNVKQSLAALVRDAEHGTTASTTALKAVQDNVEVWFNDTMSRVGGWYKRKTQFVLLGVALVLAGVLNVDTIAISRTLAQNNTLRESIVATAQKAAAEPAPSDGSASRAGAAAPATQPATLDELKAANERFDKSLREIDRIGLPIGWKTLAGLEEERAGDSRKAKAHALRVAAAVLEAVKKVDEAVADPKDVMKGSADEGKAADLRKKAADAAKRAKERADSVNASAAKPQNGAADQATNDPPNEGKTSANPADELAAANALVPDARVAAAEAQEASRAADEYATVAAVTAKAAADDKNADKAAAAKIQAYSKVVADAAAAATKSAGEAKQFAGAAEHAWTFANLSEESLAADPRRWPEGAGWVLKIFGILLTALAASLGAPFWFDMLNKIINIRSAGKSPTEDPTAPAELPTSHDPRPDQSRVPTRAATSAKQRR